MFKGWECTEMGPVSIATIVKGQFEFTGTFIREILLRYRVRARSIVLKILFCHRKDG